ncbi:MAG: phosphotransferase [Salinivirgaceae bacterium]|nr:phosphotransferase [Salinivirgaceae bacterium]
MDKENMDILQSLFLEWSGQVALKIVKLPASGSSRQYYRLSNDQAYAIGAVNGIVEENRAYISFTDCFVRNNINVPKILQISSDEAAYLVEDIGDDSLYNKVLDCKGDLSPEVLELYKKALKNLVMMQVDAGNSLNYDLCYPVSEFNEQAIQWDLNYFKYNFLKLTCTDFNELALENDFEALKEFLLKVPRDYFMFRDFQSRNILVKENEPVFIDFQGGRKGPLAYDVASLLYQAKAQLSSETRMELFKYYYKELSKKIDGDYESLLSSFKGFALVRTLQVLGAYGFRGYFEKKPHFIESIPFAIENLKELLINQQFPIDLPHIKIIANSIVLPEGIKFTPNEDLTVSITSFSYKKGIPADPSENGGGYVFDCRSIHNPGRYKDYQQLTGKDQAVIDFFEREDEMEAFLSRVFSLVDTSVEVYKKRNFKHLMVNFGCTGGQHRSVYSAERLKGYLEEKYKLNINLWHREQDF